MNLGVLFNTDRLDQGEFLEYARRIDDLGYESLWLPELFSRDPFTAAAFLLANTQQLMLATGIANIYARDPAATVATASTLQELSDGRFILGLGVSNAGLNATRGHSWTSPVAKTRDYLRAMREVKLTVDRQPCAIHVAAHGPKMLSVAGAMADGANTYLMPLAHVSAARQQLDDHAPKHANPTLNTMLFCLHDEDPVTARQTARKSIGYYTGLDYYHRAWRQFGFDDSDFADGGSDRLIDALVAWGSMQKIQQRIQQQFDLGATRVVVIPVGAGLGGQPDWTLLSHLVG